jgi:DNA-binding response OmpR family regulator
VGTEFEERSMPRFMGFVKMEEGIGAPPQALFDAAEAASSSKDATPDLALVELLISGGGGTELCRQLTERRARVLATSVLDLREEALATGADAFLPKPFEPLQLVSTVRDLLGASALVRPTPERTAP